MNRCCWHRRITHRKNRILLVLLVAVMIHSAHRTLRLLGTVRRLSSPMVVEDEAIVVNVKDDYFARVLPGLMVRKDDADAEEEERGRQTRGGANDGEGESEGEIEGPDFSPATTSFSSTMTAAVRVRFYAEGDARRCHLNVTDLRYVGCGLDGQAYEAPMDCEDDGDHPHRPLSPSRSRRVVVKVLTSRVDPRVRGQQSPRKFVVAGGGGEDPITYAGLYRRMMSGLPPMAAGTTIAGGGTTGGNNSTIGRIGMIADVASAERRFALAMGTADVPLDALHEAVDRAVSASRYGCRYDVLRPPASASIAASAHDDTADFTAAGPRHSFVTAKISPFNPGECLDLEELRGMDPHARRGIVRDLVRIHRHMFLRGVVHCDMALYHYYHATGLPVPAGVGGRSDGGGEVEEGENVTTLIDFERFEYGITDATAGDAGRLTLLMQLWQVIAIIGTVCSPPVGITKEDIVGHRGGFVKAIDTGEDGGGFFVIPRVVCERRGRFNLEYASKKLMPRLVTALEGCGFDRIMGWNGGALNDAAGMYEELAMWSGV